MEEICGYIDENGKFFKTKFEISQNNINKKIAKLQNKLGIVKTDFINSLHKSTFRSINAERNYINAEKHLKYFINEIVYYRREEFIELSNEIVNLEKECEKLEKLHDLPKILRKDWWFNNILEF